MTKRNHASWRETIDGWVRDPAIRRHSLIALAMILTAAIVIVILATGALGAATSALLPSALAKAIAGVSALGTSGTGWWLLRSRQRRLARTVTPSSRATRSPKRSAWHPSWSARNP